MMYCLEEHGQEVEFPPPFFRSVDSNANTIMISNYPFERRFGLWNRLTGYRPVGWFSNDSGEIDACLLMKNTGAYQWQFPPINIKFVLLRLRTEDPRNIRWVEERSFVELRAPREVMADIGGQVDDKIMRRSGTRLTPNCWYPMTTLSRCNFLLCGAKYAIEFVNRRCFRYKIVRPDDSLLCQAAAFLAGKSNRSRRRLIDQLPTELARLVKEFQRTKRLPDEWV